MFERMRKHLTFANVASAMALFIALGGVAYAGAELSKNSVGAAQIEKNAVGASEVKNGSLSCAELNAATGPCTSTVRSTTATFPLDCTETNPFPNAYFLNCTSPQQTVRAACNRGEHATGGGYKTPPKSSNFPTSSVEVFNSVPDTESGTPHGWAIQAEGTGSNSASFPGVAHPSDPSVTVYAVCSP